MTLTKVTFMDYSESIDSNSELVLLHFFCLKPAKNTKKTS